MKKTTKIILSTLLAVIMCCTLFACAGKPTPTPPDTSLERLTTYLETTLFYDMAKNQTVTAKVKVPRQVDFTFTIYTDDNDVYSKETVDGANNSSYTKSFFNLADSTNEENVTSYTLDEPNSSVHSSLSLLAIQISPYSGLHLDMTCNRTDTYVKNSDDSQTLTFEYNKDIRHVKQVFSFTKDDKLSRIQLFRSGEGNVLNIEFAYSTEIPATPAAVKALQIHADKVYFTLLRARNRAALFAEGASTKLQKLKFEEDFNWIYDKDPEEDTNGIYDKVPEEDINGIYGKITQKSKKTLTMIGNQYIALNTFEKNEDNITYNSSKSSYANENWLYSKISETNNNVPKEPLFLVLPISYYVKRNTMTLPLYDIKYDISICLATDTEQDFTKTIKQDEITKQQVTVFKNITGETTTEITFDNEGRIISFLYTEGATFINKIKLEYNFTDTIEIPQEFKDYEFSDSDLAKVKYLQVLKASGEKALAEAGGLQVTLVPTNPSDDSISPFAFSIECDTNMHFTGNGTADGDSIYYIYGNKAFATYNNSVYDSSFLFNSFIFSFAELNIRDHPPYYASATFALEGNVITVTNNYGNPVKITFNEQTNQIISYLSTLSPTEEDEYLCTFDYKKIEPIVIPQECIDSILANS